MCLPPARCARCWLWSNICFCYQLTTQRQVPIQSHTLRVNRWKSVSFNGSIRLRIVYWIRICLCVSWRFVTIEYMSWFNSNKNKENCKLASKTVLFLFIFMVAVPKCLLPSNPRVQNFIICCQSGALGRWIRSVVAFLYIYLVGRLSQDVARPNPQQQCIFVLHCRKLAGLFMLQ